MLFITLIMVHMCAAFPLKCPETAQWPIRARGLCLDPSKYSCLKNDNANGYSENCTISDFLAPGRKHVLRGGLDADICSSERYQPWQIIYHTNVSTNCIFLKSTCHEEGQVIHTYGNSTTDTSCRCDYTRGYDFLVKPQNSCFCIPTIEECSCYLKTCQKQDDKLSPDYKCLPVLGNKTLTISECKPIIYKRDKIGDGKESTKHSTRGKEISQIEQSQLIITVVIGLILFLPIGILLRCRYFRKESIKKSETDQTQVSVHKREETSNAAIAGKTTRYCFRVMILGEPSIGKTCLMNRLLNKTIDNVKITNGIDIDRRTCQIDFQSGKWILSKCQEPSMFSSDHSEQFVECEFWDFAGIKEFYATYQTFISANAVYLLVVDISKDFTANTYDNMIENEFDSIGEYIDFWLDNIHCYSTDGNTKSNEDNSAAKITPPVIIVGTGIDKIPTHERETRKTNFQKHLHTILSDFEKRRHLRKPHFLSNTIPTENKEEFKLLRDDIFQEAKTLKNFESNPPSRWTDLETKLHRKRNLQVITYREARDLAAACSFPDIEELDTFLKYEHDIGVIFFFKDIKDFIILDPKWIVEVFRMFVSNQYKSDSIGMTEWSVFEKTGKLKDNLIVELLTKIPNFSLEKYKNFVLKIMENFEIIVKPINGKNEDMYMPYMIKATSLYNNFERSAVENQYCEKSSWFCLEFNFLPTSYFCHILLSFAENNNFDVDSKEKRFGIFRNIGIFRIDKTGSQILVMRISNSLIAMQVRQLSKCDEHICQSSFKNNLISIVDLMNLRYLNNINYHKLFKCSEGKYNEDVGRIKYEIVMQPNPYQCPEHEEMHSSIDIFKYWMTENEIKEENIKNRQSWCERCEYRDLCPCIYCKDVIGPIAICKHCFHFADEVKH